MADVRAFRALRYDERAAGPLESLVAPPYDVISEEQRREYLARSPYNIVHLTLPESEADAARALREWRERGVLVEEGPAAWTLSQRYVGPDGVERTRNGIVVALRLESYDRRIVLPHERTHAGPKEGRLRLLRAARTQLEPIFLLHDGATVELPPRDPDLAVGGDRLWRGADVPDVDQLLIADGHHRYETALAFHAEDGTEATAWMMVVLVSMQEEGLEIFPTHRIVEGFAQTPPLVDADGGAEAALARLPDDRAAFVYAENGRVATAVADDPGPDVVFLDRFGPKVVAYTPDVSEALGRGAAVLVRPPRIDDVFAIAARGEVMPQKTTYFFPKLTSGLLLQPLD